ncbi:hypothetical protein U2A4042360135 [Corynebacterium striatum]|nr:hypothetical protein U2A4042360135 [Corynebacterium striatum]
MPEVTILNSELTPGGSLFQKYVSERTVFGWRWVGLTHAVCFTFHNRY